MKFYVINAFTDHLFGGNPAGIGLVDEFPKKSLMQKIATELDYSETVFCKREGSLDFHLRYFTPTNEVDLCGHGTIAAFKSLSDQSLIASSGNFNCITKSGDLNITVDKNIIMMEMPPPCHKKTFNSPNGLDELYSIMGLDYKEAQQKLGTLRPMIIGSGLFDIFLPVHEKSSLDSMVPNMQDLSALSKREKVTGVHAFALNPNTQTQEVSAFCRNFAPLFGIDEEAATGTASAGLAYYMYKNSLISEFGNMTFIQGESMGRPSKIIVSIHESDDSPLIKIGGPSIILFDGDLNI